MNDRGTRVMSNRVKDMQKNLRNGEWTKYPSRDQTPSREPTPARELTPMRYVHPRRNRWILPLLGAGAVGGAALLTKKYWMPAVKRGLKNLNPYIASINESVHNRFNKISSMFNRTAPSIPSLVNQTRAD